MCAKSFRRMGEHFPPIRGPSSENFIFFDNFLTPIPLDVCKMISEDVRTISPYREFNSENLYVSIVFDPTHPPL